MLWLWKCLHIFLQQQCHCSAFLMRSINSSMQQYFCEWCQKVKALLLWSFLLGSFKTIMKITCTSLYCSRCFLQFRHSGAYKEVALISSEIMCEEAIKLSFIVWGINRHVPYWSNRQCLVYTQLSFVRI